MAPALPDPTEEAAETLPSFTSTSFQIENQHEQQVHDNNFSYALLFDVIAIVCFFAYLIFIVPSIAHWIASGRFKQGLSLRKWCRQSSKAKGESDDQKLVPAAATKQFDTPSLSINTAFDPIMKQSTYYESITTSIFNKLFLAQVPLFGFTIGQTMIMASYTIVVAICLFCQTSDLKKNYRRAGLVAVVQLPFIFLLAARNGFACLTGLSYEKLSYLHRFAGRCMVTCGIIHGALYLHYQGPAEGWSSDELSGIVTLCALLLIFVTSLYTIRQAFYQLFMFSHLVGWPVTLVALWIHSPDAKPHVIACICFIALDYIIRLFNTKFKVANLRSAPGGCSMITVNSLNDGWRAGQHCLLRIYKGTSTFESHPLTICNAPSQQLPAGDARGMVLCCKATGRWSSDIYAAGMPSPFHNSEEQKPSITSVFVEGPYGGPKYHDFCNSEVVILIAGGSGITFIFAMIEDMIGSALKGEAVTRQVYIVWAVRDREMLMAFSVYLSQLLELSYFTRLQIKLNVHLTTKREEINTWTEPYPLIRGEIKECRPNIMEYIKLAASCIEKNIDNENENQRTRGGGLTVSACGPKSIIKDVRECVAMYDFQQSIRIGGIKVHCERFDL